MAYARVSESAEVVSPPSDVEKGHRWAEISESYSPPLCQSMSTSFSFMPREAITRLLTSYPCERLWKKFCSAHVAQSPFLDPRGKAIAVVRKNFPKLAGLKHLTLSKEELSASAIVSAIENGCCDLKDYYQGREDRIRTIFWIPEVLREPDAIYRNAHKIVAGDEVYVRVYDKMGSKVKLVFTMDVQKGGQIIRTVPITSFLTDPATAASYVRGEPVFRRK